MRTTAMRAMALEREEGAVKQERPESAGEQAPAVISAELRPQVSAGVRKQSQIA